MAYWRLLLFGLLVLGAPASARAQYEYDQRSLAPFVPTPQEVVERMLRLADVKKDEIVFDLGCGDGRILITAAQKFGARATGIELDPELFKQTEARVHELRLDDRVKVIHGDLMKADLSSADVVCIYLLTSSNSKVRPNLEKYLRPGTRVVTHDFPILGWTASRVEKVARDVRTHTLYLYHVAAKSPASLLSGPPRNPRR